MKKSIMPKPMIPLASESFEKNEKANIVGKNARAKMMVRILNLR